MAELSFEDFDNWCDERGIAPDDPRVPVAFAQYLSDKTGRDIDASPVLLDEDPSHLHYWAAGALLLFIILLFLL